MNTDLSNIILAPWINGVLVTAIRLNVFTILNDRELTLGEIASECRAVPERLKTLLDACVCLGLLEFMDRTYKNSHFGAVYFVEGNPFYIGDFLKLLNYESLQWYQLPSILLGEKKKDFELPGLKADHQTFVSAMNCIGQLGEADALKAHTDLSGVKSLTDAGGGSGLYSLMLCQSYPELQSTILDLKDTLAVTRKIIADSPCRNRIHLKEGDFFKDPLGRNLDAVLLSDVMYGAAGAKDILRNAWNSLSDNGLLIVRGYYADPEHSGPLFGALFAVKLLVDDPHQKNMSISDLAGNVTEAGFSIQKMVPLTERSYVLVARKQTT